MANFLQDNADLRFYLDKGIDWSTLIRLTEHDGRAADGPATEAEAVETYREVLEMVGSFVAEEIAPYAAEIDHDPLRFEDGEVSFTPRLQAIFDQIRDLELHGLCVPREFGGANLPMIAYFVVAELMARADVSIMAHHSFHGGIALAMLVYSVREGTTRVDPKRAFIEETRFAPMIEEIVRGEAWGCMDITEPDAGSDMAALRTVAEQDEDGNWYVTGTKIFITSGHGKYHFVIARTEPAAAPDDPFGGLKGLSMFLVPAWTEVDGKRVRTVTVDRIEEKIGHHASVTAQVSFEKSPAMLVGKRGEGFVYMLVLMNNARVGVGFECLGLCEASWRLAKDYAAERRSMGKTIDQHEMIADYLDEMYTDIQALRALCMSAAYHEECTQKWMLRETFMRGESAESDREIDAGIAYHRVASRKLTPLLKYFGAEKSVEMGRRCIQIHGGVGYTTEYGAEKLLRDALVMPIYEGTSQIQALMAMKDTLMGVMKAPADFVREQAQARWTMLRSRDPLEQGVAKLSTLRGKALQALIVRTAGDKARHLKGVPMAQWPDTFLKDWNPKRDFAYAMLHAERLIRVLIDEAVAEILWNQAQAWPERRDVLERWLERAIPRSEWLVQEITTTGDRLLRTLADSREA